jgi:hypothetical protein
MIHRAKSLDGYDRFDLENGHLSIIRSLLPSMEFDATNTAILKNLLCNFAEEIDAAAAIELKRVRMEYRGVELSRIATNDTVDSDGDIA